MDLKREYYQTAGQCNAAYSQVETTCVRERYDGVSWRLFWCFGCDRGSLARGGSALANGGIIVQGVFLQNSAANCPKRRNCYDQLHSVMTGVSIRVSMRASSKRNARSFRRGRDRHWDLYQVDGPAKNSAWKCPSGDCDHNVGRLKSSPEACTKAVGLRVAV